MKDMIIKVNTLPETLHRRLRSERVRVREENGEIILTPVVNNDNLGETPKPKLRLGFVDLPPLPDSFFDPLPEEELQLWGL